MLEGIHITSPDHPPVPAPDLGRVTYWAVGAVFDRMVTIREADSVREGWYEAVCECNWEISGGEPVVEDAAHEHVGRAHKSEVDAERVFLVAARAYCEAKYEYMPSDYVTLESFERHIQADTAVHARGGPFRASIAAVLAAVAGVGAAPPPPTGVPSGGAEHAGCSGS